MSIWIYFFWGDKLVDSALNSAMMLSKEHGSQLIRRLLASGKDATFLNDSVIPFLEILGCDELSGAPM